MRTKGIELYKKADELLVDMESNDFSWKENEKRFVELLNEFFANPTQESGFSSKTVWKRINELFESYSKSVEGDIDYNYLILQCRIDCFFAELIERYDVQMAKQILDTTTKIYVSDEIEDLMAEKWDDLEEVASDIAEYLVNDHIKCDNLSELHTGGPEVYVMFKIIDDLNIPENKKISSRVRIIVDHDGKVSVDMIIHPKGRYGDAVLYDITTKCKEWIDTLK